MVYETRPITKFCCADTPESEVRIIARFSIISTTFCLFLLYLAFAHLQGMPEPYDFGTRLQINRTSCNVSDTNSNCTDEFEYIKSTTAHTEIGSSKKSEKKSISTLAWICLLLEWDRGVQWDWILVPFVWNLCDLFRGFLLLYVVTKKNAFFLKLWYMLTSANTLTGLLIFYPILTNYKTGDLVAAFIVLFLLLLFYNWYSLWIVNVFLKEMTANTSTVGNHLELERTEHEKSVNDASPVERF